MRTPRVLLLAALGALSALASTPASAGEPTRESATEPTAAAEAVQPVGTTRLVSRLRNGEPAEGGGSAPTISGDGRLVAFESKGHHFVAGENIKGLHIYLRDQRTRTNTLVDRAPNGKPARRGESLAPELSADGRWVVYTSRAQNLVPGFDDLTWDVFMLDVATGETTAASQTPGGGEPHGASVSPSVSGDGRYVAFASSADDIVEEETTYGDDIFVFDTLTERTQLISRGLGGEVADGESSGASMSGDGRFVAFDSSASNLMPSDTNEASDVFRYDLTTDTMTVVPSGTHGEEANGSSYSPALSADGQSVTYLSRASNLATGDAGRKEDVFLTDLSTRRTTLVSRTPGGESDNGTSSGGPAISADGLLIVYDCGATDLLPTDTNRKPDIFLFDVQSATTSIVSVASDGSQANERSFHAAISADGGRVGFASPATNLVPDETSYRADVYIHRLS